MHLQEAQMQLYEHFHKLETRISIDFLPRNFDQLESVITCDDYFPVIKDNIAVQFKQKHYKIIQEAKRTWLNMYMEAYEIKIEDNAHQSEQEFKQLKSKTNLTRVNHTDDGTTSGGVINAFINYMNHRTKRMMEEIYYDKIPDYRRQLLRVRRRLESTKKLPKVSVWPKVIIDLIYHPFTVTQLAYLSRGNFEQNNLQSHLKKHYSF
jgi:hypothetical protein